MDFEEQLEKAERLSSPSLVGASIRSADDSAHNNYIHPEKSRSSSRKREKSSRSSRLSNLAMSLDELMNEGALLGSEENFESYLDDEGHVKKDIISAESPESEQSSPLKKKVLEQEDIGDFNSKQGVQTAESASPENVSEGVSDIVLENTSEHANAVSNKDIDKSSTQLSKTSVISEIGETSFNDISSGVSSENPHLYSTPNLSEYQLDHQITDHLDLLKNIQSHDPHRLPTNREYNTSNREPNMPRKKDFTNASPQKDSKVYDNSYVDNVFPIRSGLHTPYFQTDSRDTSRARSVARSEERSRSRSAMRPHLARGDSYKNTHEIEPAKYELPAQFQNEVELQEVDESFEERTTRDAKPTMGDSIAAAESGNAYINPSLVTTGDYTNFNVDNPEPNSLESFFARRSLSSTNYLRSISRSRSVAHDNEKNDANIDNLVEEGALVNDDPYSTINDLNEMVENVLHTKDVTAKHLDNELNERDEGESSIQASNNAEPTKSPVVTSEDEEDIEESNNKASEKNEEIMDATEVDDNTDKVEVAETREVESTKENHSTGEPDAGYNTSKNLDLVEKERETTEVPEKATEESTESIKSNLDLEKNEDLVSSHLPEEREEDKKVDIKSNLAGDGNEVKEDSIEFSENQEKAIHSEEEIERKSSEDHDESIEPIILLEKTDESVENVGLTNTDKSQEENSNEDQKEEEDLNAEMNTKEIKEEDDAINKSTEIDDKKSEPENLLSDSSEDSFTREVGEVGVHENETSEDKGEEEKSIDDNEAQVVGKKDEIFKEEGGAVKNSDVIENSNPSGATLNAIEDESKEKGIEKDSSKNISENTEEIDSKNTVDVDESNESESKEQKDNSKTLDLLSPKDEDDLDDLDISPEDIRKHLESQPVYLFTSFAGGMQVMTRTNRLATILQGNGVKFTYRDLGTDEEAKKLWKRHGNGKMLPGVVRGDDVIGNFSEIEEINEEYRLLEVLYETL